MRDLKKEALFELKFYLDKLEAFKPLVEAKIVDVTDALTATDIKQEDHDIIQDELSELLSEVDAGIAKLTYEIDRRVKYEFSLHSSPNGFTTFWNNIAGRFPGLVSDIVAPIAPVLEVITPEINQATLAWNVPTDNVGVTNYDVFRKTDAGAFSLLVNVLTNAYVDLTASFGATYTYYVIAKDVAGNSSVASNEESVTPLNA